VEGVLSTPAPPAPLCGLRVGECRPGPTGSTPRESGKLDDICGDPKENVVGDVVHTNDFGSFNGPDPDPDPVGGQNGCRGNKIGMLGLRGGGSWTEDPDLIVPLIEVEWYSAEHMAGSCGNDNDELDCDCDCGCEKHGDVAGDGESLGENPILSVRAR
jgi:hypothetical protein